jgi:hypothetical protein
MNWIAMTGLPISDNSGFLSVSSGTGDAENGALKGDGEFARLLEASGNAVKDAGATPVPMANVAGLPVFEVLQDTPKYSAAPLIEAPIGVPTESESLEPETAVSFPETTTVATETSGEAFELVAPEQAELATPDEAPVEVKVSDVPVAAPTVAEAPIQPRTVSTNTADEPFRSPPASDVDPSLREVRRPLTPLTEAEVPRSGPSKASPGSAGTCCFRARFPQG